MAHFNFFAKKNTNKSVKFFVTDITNVTVVSEVLICSYRTDNSV